MTEASPTHKPRAFNRPTVYPAEPVASHVAPVLVDLAKERARKQRAALAGFLSLGDFEAAARRHLPKPIFGYIAGAAEENRTLRANRAAFDRYESVPRVFVNTTGRSAATRLFDKVYTAPFGIAPMGLAALAAYRGDFALATAASKEGIPSIMSGSSLTRLEDVAQAAPETWFQAYLPGDTAGIVALLSRVEQAGFRTLVVTVDTPVAGNRDNNVRAGFSTPLRPSVSLAWQGMTHPRWLLGTLARTLATVGMPHFENNAAGRGAPIISPTVARDFSGREHLDWPSLDLVRSCWPERLVVKGILDPRDARRAAEAGVDGIIVSSHGGRQLDGAVAPMTVLPSIVAACPRIPVMLDSGVRRGGDVLRAVALGARFVFVGRPFMYAATVGGEAGVRKGISLLKEEISRDMALMGVLSPSELDRSHLIDRLRGEDLRGSFT